MKGDYSAKRSTFGSIKKRFSDITNSLPQQQNSPPVIVKTVPPLSSPEKELVDNIIKENMALAKLIQDRNNIIEMKGTELQNNRINLQKLQLQNWSLAKLNSQMMVELNIGKMKLKSLQHELSCKEALLQAKDKDVKILEQEEEVVIPADMKAEDQTDKSTTNLSRCRGLPRSRSLSQAISTQQAAENKRRCVRRQLTNSRTQRHQSESIGKLLEIEVTDFSPAESTHFSRLEKKDCFELESRRTDRSSIGRPMRKAAEKVQSYKETPLNIKMRRSD